MNPELKYQLLAFTYPNFQALLNQATVMEAGKKENNIKISLVTPLRLLHVLLIVMVS